VTRCYVTKRGAASLGQLQPRARDRFGSVFTGRGRQKPATSNRRTVANRWCPATLFIVVGLAVIPVGLPSDRSRAYRDKKRDMACHLIRECQDSAMKVRCPDCGYITDHLPPTHRCPNCDSFSHEWLIYDWESFASIKRLFIRCNLLIIGITLINTLVAITSESTNARQWLFSLLFIPAMISLFICRRQLRRKSEYEGHKSRGPWFIGGGGL